mmetsp:Transcript_5023/g.9548  ORF Transcript_5023/g.9548 Transcript_5023/m.9548 type:complete len:90 (+) Transcript_5023:1-270(+)
MNSFFQHETSDVNVLVLTAMRQDHPQCCIWWVNTFLYDKSIQIDEIHSHTYNCKMAPAHKTQSKAAKKAARHVIKASRTKDQKSLEKNM